MDKEKIKLLDDFQVYQLIHLNQINGELLDVLRTEFDARKLGGFELIRLREEFHLQHPDHSCSNTKLLNPLITPFLLKRHLLVIAKLKSEGKQADAKSYQSKLFLGMIVEGLVTVVLTYFYYEIN